MANDEKPSLPNIDTHDATGKPIAKVELPEQKKEYDSPDPKFSPGRQHFAIEGQKNAILVLDPLNGNVVQTLVGHADSLNYFDFSRDGKQLISCSEDATIRIWDLQSGKETQKLKVPSKAKDFLRFAPDGKRVFASTNEGSLLVWNLVNSKVETMENVELGYPGTFLVEPGGEWLVYREPGVLNIARASDGGSLAKLKGHLGGTDLMVLSADGKTLITAGDDRAYGRTIRVWDLSGVSATNE